MKATSGLKEIMGVEPMYSSFFQEATTYYRKSVSL